jgi:hypothetical protein
MNTDKELKMHDDLDQDALAALNARLRRLEQNNRRLAWFAATAAAASILLLIAAGAVRNQVPDKIEAKEFVLLSPEGKVIGKLGANILNERPYLQFINQKGRIGLEMDDEGLVICGKVGDGRGTSNGRIFLRRNEDGECSLLFRDDQGRIRLQTGITKNNAPGLMMWDRTLADRIALTMDAESDTPYISLGDGHAPRMVASLSAQGAASLSLNDPRGGNALQLEGGGRDENGRIGLFDTRGKERASLKVGAGGAPVLGLYGEDGKSLVDLPK